MNIKKHNPIATDLHYWEYNDWVDFPGKRPVCKNCKFCDFIVHEDEFNSREYICHLMPTSVKKSPVDWCGQYEERKLDLDYILSFDEDIILGKSLN